ncbi:MAG: hypothetical protein JWN93_3635 [Hyphomicrobiales bacterium]|jgi:uncharacterized protein (DUF1778 family)|nr:hypothetical protein [Hyphomicrobiales bacterium]
MSKLLKAAEPQSPSKTGRKALREERLAFRLDSETRSLVARAAELERRSLTDFCLGAVTEAARKSLAASEVLALAEADRRVFFDALVSPPEPNARLRDAFKAARDRIGS